MAKTALLNLKLLFGLAETVRLCDVVEDIYDSVVSNQGLLPCSHADPTYIHLYGVHRQTHGCNINHLFKLLNEIYLQPG